MVPAKFCQSPVRGNNFVAYIYSFIIDTMPPKNIDVILEKLDDELQDLATLKDVRKGLLLKHKEIEGNLGQMKQREGRIVEMGLTEDANKVANVYGANQPFFQENNDFEQSYENMKAYLRDIIQNLKKYKQVKEDMATKMSTMDKEMRFTMNESLRVINRVTTPPRLRGQAQGGAKSSKGKKGGATNNTNTKTSRK
jgi:hypothetical protein